MYSCYNDQDFSHVINVDMNTKACPVVEIYLKCSRDSSVLWKMMKVEAKSRPLVALKISVKNLICLYLLLPCSSTHFI